MTKQEANHAEATELAMFALNDGSLYDQCALPTIRNLAAKIRKGTYDAELAVKAWRYMADAAAKKYRTEFSMTGGFSPATRDMAARDIAAHYAEQLEEAASLHA